MEYLIPLTVSHYEHEIKKSRFIAYLKHIESAKQARQWFVEISSEYPDARHVCWAYIAGQPGNSAQAMSDDGEPAGTAGKPILNVLQHSNVGEIAVVVVRYFGGVKLGAGGLVRAYSTAAAEALKLATLVRKVARQQIKLRLPFSEENTFRHILEQFDGEIEVIDYADQVTIQCQLPARKVGSFLRQLPHNIIEVAPDNES